MKLNQQEKEKLTKQYQDWCIQKAKEVVATDIIVETPDFWLSKIDTILEERREKVRGEIETTNPVIQGRHRVSVETGVNIFKKIILNLPILNK